MLQVPNYAMDLIGTTNIMSGKKRDISNETLNERIDESNRMWYKEICSLKDEVKILKKEIEELKAYLQIKPE